MIGVIVYQVLGRLLRKQVWWRLPEKVLVWIASLVVKRRPLEPYPGWYFGIDERHPDRMTRFRLTLWEAFKDRGIQRPITVCWHEGIRLRLYLGNDLSRCLFIGGCIEPNELAFFAQVLAPGMVVIDAGANEGLYAVVAGRHVGSTGVVLAVEPSKRESARLRANIALNGLHNVRVIDAALSDAPGTGVLRVADAEHTGQNTLGDFIYQGVATSGTQEVALTTLDEVVVRTQLRGVDVIKMDVEGAEFKLLKGGEQTIRRHKPLLLLELSDAALRQQGSSAEDVLAFLDGLGYRFLTYDEATGLPVEAAQLHPLTPNVVAWHKDRPSMARA
jgi:FkbM family methyltransferase